MRIESSDIPKTVIKVEKANHAIKEQTQNSDEQESKQQEIKKSDVAAVVDKFNDFLSPLQTDIKFKFHEELNEYYVEVVNPITDETVREIPPKKMLDMYAAMADFMGLLVDKKI